MAKLFVQSVRCPVCSHANDWDFRFCQRCGYIRKVKKSVPSKEFNVDLDTIDQRLQQLSQYDQATSYSKQKASLQKELEDFLTALPGYSTIATVTPRNICRFLVHKDKQGKTQVHRNSL